MSIPFVEFILELNPVQSKSMKKTLHGIHTKENSQSGSCENKEIDNILNERRFTRITPLYPITMLFSTVFSKNTSESWECARDKAQSLK